MTITKYVAILHRGKDVAIAYKDLGRRWDLFLCFLTFSSNLEVYCSNPPFK